MSTYDRSLQGLISRRPLLTFLVLSYAFFWLFLALSAAVILGPLGLNPTALPSWLLQLLTIVGSWMPAAASAIITGNLEGRDGNRKLFSKFIQFRLPPRWYLAALIPFGLAFMAAWIYRLTGGVASGGVSLSLSFWVLLLVMNLLQGSTGEEPGWRGFALPRLLQRYSPLKAGLILGVIWAGWHAPTWFLSGYSSLDLLLYCTVFSVGIVSLSVLMTWIFCKTSTSLVPMVIAHLSFDTGMWLVGPAGIGFGAALPLWSIMAALLLVTATVVWAAGGLSVRPTLSATPVGPPTTFAPAS
jgi:membrane protease YdiL (CAAX protease family)